MTSLEQQIKQVEALIRTGHVKQGRKPLFQILVDRPWEKNARPPPLSVPDIPQNAGEAAVRFNALQAWINADLSHQSFLDAFGPWSEE